MLFLVTGANGYIGSKLVHRLCENKLDVVAVDKSTERIDGRAHILQTDIFKESGDFWHKTGKPDVCLHLAWCNGFVHNDIAHIENLPNHFLFLKNMIDDGLPQLAVMGSMHEVGYHVGEINDDTPCNPQSFYGIAKNCLRQCLMTYAMSKPFVLQWLRAFYIYGDDEFGNSIFCKIRKAANQGEKCFPFTSGKNKYDFLHIDRLVDQIIGCLRQREVAGIINICSGEPVSLGEMVETYIRSNSLDIKLEYGKYPDRIYDSPCTYGNSKKIQKIMSRSF